MQRRGAARPSQRPARRRGSAAGTLPRQPTSRVRSQPAGVSRGTQPQQQWCSRSSTTSGVPALSQ
eukprot:11410862-Alexandrium_andersonii.AAC.1